MPSWRLAVVCAAIAVIATARLDGFDVLLLTRAYCWAMLALSTWFLLRVSGRASLGNAAFQGVAAYVVGVAATRWDIDNIWVVLGIAVAGAAVVGVVIGSVSARLSGFHFLLITLAFAEMLRSLALRWRTLGGEDGISGLTRPSTWPVPLDLTDSRHMAWFVLGLLAVAVLALVVVLRSPFGAAVIGVRDSPTRMAALGYSPARYRIGAVVVASAIAALAGVANAYAVRFVSPADFVPLVSAKALLFAVVGGAGLLGAAASAVVLTFVENELSGRFDRWPMVLGLVYVAIAMIGPAPMRGLRARLAPVLHRRRSTAPAQRRALAGRPAEPVSVDR
ncbi:MAG: branched-chain amino acid ABC transporter permease [Ilumatobacteraceae bacterium]